MNQEQQDTATDSAETQRRTALVKGLRDFADFLETTPAMPAPYRIGGAIVAQSVEEFDEIAEVLDGQPEAGFTSHQVETRRFGPVELTLQIGREKILEDRERKLAEREAQAAQAAA